VVKEKTMLFCYSALLAQHPAFEFHCGALGHALHMTPYPK
jgi:hypothetical protein